MTRLTQPQIERHTVKHEGKRCDRCTYTVRNLMMAINNKYAIHTNIHDDVDSSPQQAETDSENQLTQDGVSSDEPPHDSYTLSRSHMNMDELQAGIDDLVDRQTAAASLAALSFAHNTLYLALKSTSRGAFEDALSKIDARLVALTEPPATSE
jgi:hypothetical protein